MIQKDFEDVKNSGFSLNICNDTVIPCINESNGIELNFDSPFIYRDNKGHCTKMAGSYFKNEDIDEKNNFLIREEDNKFIFNSTGGDKCGESNFYTTYKFINDKNLNNSNVVYEKIVPNIMNLKCSREIEIKTNFEKSIEHLILQRIFNDYWLLTGFIFFIIGIYLMIMAQNKKATKFVICIIFGQILSFSIAVGILDIKNKYMEWSVFSVGLFIGGFIGYFCLEKNKLFRGILSITAGFIFGLFMFDIMFYHQNYQYAAILLTDSVLIFMSLWFSFIYLLPEFHYYCDSIIGSYLFIRGITILLQKVGKYGRYRELQLSLYLINRFEFDYANYFYKEHWPTYLVFAFFIFNFMIVSMLYYYFKAVGKDEDEEEEIDEKNPEEKLIGSQKSTYTDDIEELE